MEEWRDVIGFEGIYQVSNLGNVKSLAREVRQGNRIVRIKEKLLCQNPTRYGYLCVKFFDQKKHSVHRLVADAFLGEHPNLDVDHIDADRSNNNLTNLRWVTRSENVLHAFAIGNRTMKYGNNPIAKRICLYNKQEMLSFSSISECTTWLKKKYDIGFTLSTIAHHLREYNGSKQRYYDYYVKY